MIETKTGLQMYSVREAFRFKPIETVKKVSEIGYKYLELPFHDARHCSHEICGMDSKQLKNLAEQYRVVFTGGYVEGLTRGNMEEVVSFYKEIGSDHITLPIGYYADEEMLKSNISFYNELSRVCRAYDMTLCYENHYHEFQELNHKCILDIIMSETDERYFKLNLNTYWLMRGLMNPTEIFRKYKSRIMALVQQDYPLDQIDKINMWEFHRYHPIARNMRKDVLFKEWQIENIHPVMCTLYTEIGDGILKIQEMYEEVKASETISYVFLKQDYTRMPSEFESILRSKQNYEKLQGVIWR